MLSINQRKHNRATSDLCLECYKIRDDGNDYVLSIESSEWICLSLINKAMENQSSGCPV